MIYTRIGLFEKYIIISEIESILPISLIGSNYINQANKNIDKKFFTILGLIPTKHIHKVRKILFRISRDNIMIKTVNIRDFSDDIINDYYKED